MRGGELYLVDSGAQYFDGTTDITRTIAIGKPTAEMKDPWGNTKIGVTATTKINRIDFGVKWNAPLASGGLVVSEEVAITLDVEFNKKPEPTGK